MTIKTCPHCKESKNINQFNKDKLKASGIADICRPCAATKSAKWRADNPQRNRDNELKRMYGISLDQYNKLLSKQKGVCAICKLPERAIRVKTGKLKELVPDHDHAYQDLTGIVKIRGLLCHTCNTGIGMFEDNPNTLRNATKYILKSQSLP